MWQIEPWQLLSILASLIGGAIALVVAFRDSLPLWLYLLILIVLGLLLAGCLVWLILMTMNLSRPKLEMPTNPDVRKWQLLNKGETRIFATLEITNKRSQTAQRCVAVAEIIKHPNSVTHLQRLYPLHWADVPYSTLSTGAEPVEIGGEPRRLDVAFTLPNRSGASIAMPIALALPGEVPQAYFPPGEYILRLKVKCENGRGDTKQFKLISPNNWEELDMKRV